MVYLIWHSFGGWSFALNPDLWFESLAGCSTGWYPGIGFCTLSPYCLCTVFVCYIVCMLPAFLAKHSSSCQQLL